MAIHKKNIKLLEKFEEKINVIPEPDRIKVTKPTGKSRATK